MLTAKELDVVRLKDGTEGTIVFVYQHGKAYEVELVEAAGHALRTVEAEEIAEVIHRA